MKVDVAASGRVMALLLASAMAAPLASGATPEAKKAAAVSPELPAETLEASTLAGATAERVCVADIAINNIIDGRLRIFDARQGKMLGQIHTGYVGAFVLSPRADEVYVATTHFSRGTRGERIEVLEVWDSNTLTFKHEVLLPPKRAQALNCRGLLALSGNGRFASVQNATPATSLTIVDLAERKVATEIPTPGCWGTLPAASHPAHFAMLCGDGTVATVTLDDQGQVASRQVSAKLFDADQDAWFHHAERVGDRYWFLSFKGVLHELDVSGPPVAVRGLQPETPEEARRFGAAEQRMRLRRTLAADTST